MLCYAELWCTLVYRRYCTFTSKHPGDWDSDTSGEARSKREASYIQTNRSRYVKLIQRVVVVHFGSMKQLCHHFRLTYLPSCSLRQDLRFDAAGIRIGACFEHQVWCRGDKIWCRGDKIWCRGLREPDLIPRAANLVPFILHIHYITST